jgi:predicted SAM-dependent methyltransferase
MIRYARALISRPLSGQRSQFLDRLRRAREANRGTLCNLGCGTRYHGDWINVDHHGDGVNVLSWDLRQSLPLPNHCCDAVYSSHVIEHFDRDEAIRFLGECRRLLKPGGIVRLVAPDLEGLARSYLSRLDAARRGERGADDEYEWAVIELIDQMVRHRSGGEMLRLWSLHEVPAEEFVAERVGSEYQRARAHCKGRSPDRTQPSPARVGRFRLGGEVHRWMYDSYSMAKLLSSCGFTDIRSCAANESRIDGFVHYGLDTLADGTVYKPDSFFMEAVIPAGSR